MKKRISDSKAYQVFKEENIAFKTYDVKIGEHNIHFAIAGDDSLPTLMFIHGSPGSWGKYIRYMYDKDLLKKFRIISLDRPGYGFSNFGRAMHLQEQCKLIEAVLDKIQNHKPTYLCGHSYAGAVVSQLAADNPNPFTTVVIVAGAIDPAQEKREVWREILNIKPLYYFIPGAFQPSNTELLLFKNDLLLLKNDLHKITCNVIFVHGDKDKTVPIENVEYGKKMMTNSRSITIDTIQTQDHMLPFTHFSKIKNILLQLY